jgi:hypothetical protein
MDGVYIMAPLARVIICLSELNKII